VKEIFRVYQKAFESRCRRGPRESPKIPCCFGVVIWSNILLVCPNSGPKRRIFFWHFPWSTEQSSYSKMGALILRIRKLPIHFVAAKQLADTFRTRTRGGPDFEIQEKNSGFIISTMGYRLLDSPEAPGSLKVKKIRLYTQGLMTPRCRPARKIVHMYEDTSGCSNLIGWGCAAAE